MLKSKIYPVLIAVIPFMVFLGHVSFFGNYLIDDAGILFAYARNIANGYGIVAQPGLAPVEGCSDFLWMMLFVPFFWLNIFDPVVTTKIFSVFIILILYLFVSFRFRKEIPGIFIFMILIFLSIATPFVIWNSSGLENPLYILLITFLFYCSYKILIQANKNLFIAAGILSFLIAITRPDGILYFFTIPVLIILYFLLNRKQYLIPWKHLLLYFFIFVGLSGLFLIFRFMYFGELVPNTYYFKGGPEIKDILNIIVLKEEVVLKLQNLFRAVTSKFAFLTITMILILNCWLFFTRRYNVFHFCLTLFFVFTCLNFLLLPNDWMAEFRFATPFIFFFYIFLISSVYLLFKGIEKRLLLTCTALCIVLGFSIKNFHNRSTQFAKSPTVPFEVVTGGIALKFNDYAEKLKLKGASLLTPDCGGTLFYSKLRVFDMAGLIDKRYATTTLGKDREAFNNLVFETDKPTFIEIHSDWSYHTNLQQDPRFYRDYIPIVEREYMLYDKNVKEGHYVRRDANK